MNVAVIGAGWWGKNIINTFEEIESINQVFVYDIHSSVYSKLLNNSKIKIANSLEQILYDSSIQAVCVATPPQTHYEICKRLLEHGKNVLTEKPPAYEYVQVNELGKIASDKNLIYMLDALYLFLEPIRELKKIITSGVLSNIKFVQVFRVGDELRRQGAGIERIKNVMFNNEIDVLKDLFFHDVGILLYLFNDLNFISVEKQFFYNDTLCDSARILFKSNGIKIELNISWVLSGRKRSIVIYDSEYIVEYDALKDENQLSIYSLYKMDNQFFSFNNVQLLKYQLKFFIDCCRKLESNYLGHDFMVKIMKLWGKI